MVLSFFTLLVTGIEILISHPRFYWGETGNSLTAPLFRIPIPSSRATVASGYGYVLPDQNGWSRSLHFQAAWAVVLTGLVYAISGLWTGHFRNDLLRHSPPDQAEDLSYNALQRTAYLAVIFVLFPFAIWTGLALSPAFDSAVPAAVDLLGWYPRSRLWLEPADKSQGTPEEYKDASPSTSVHFGRYTVDAVKGTIAFHVDRPSFPNQDDTTRVRAYEVKGDELCGRVASRPDDSIPVTILRAVEWRRPAPYDRALDMNGCVIGYRAQPITNRSTRRLRRSRLRRSPQSLRWIRRNRSLQSRRHPRRLRTNRRAGRN